MTDARTEARAIVSAILVDERLAVGYQIETLADAIVEHIATALSAKDAELVEARAEIERLKDAIGDPQGTADHAYAFLARAERAEAQLAEARKALEPFAWIGQWLFARDLPDETPVVMVEGAGKPFALTRGMFKAAHTAARRAIEAHGGE